MDTLSRESDTKRAKPIPAPVSARALEHVLEMTKVSLEGESLNGIDFEAKELFSIRGRVMYKGRALRRVTIDAGTLGRLETDSQGHFSIEDVPEGTDYSIEVSKPGFSLDSDLVRGRVQRDIELKFEAFQLFTIAGTVLHLGAPLAEVTLNAGSLGTFVTDRYGRFVIENIPEFTSYILRPEKEGFIFSTPGAEGVLDGEPVSLLFTARRLLKISGRVFKRGLPIAGVRIEARNQAGALIQEMVTNTEGTYVFADVPEGKTYELTLKMSKHVFKKRIG